MHAKSLRRMGSITLLALVSGLLVGPTFTVPAEAAPAATLSGTVADAVTGAPIAGACITAFATGNGYEAAHTCTDPAGRYQVGGLPDGLSIKIRAVADGYVEQWGRDQPDYPSANGLTANASAPLTVDFGMRTTAGTLRGRLTDPEGRPAGGATLVLQASATGLTPRAHARTRTDGSFRLDNLAPGEYTATLLRQDLAEVTVPGVRVDPGAETILDHTFVTRLSAPLRTGRVTLTVTDKATGTRVPGAEIVVLTGNRDEIARGMTDGNGVYDLTQLPLLTSFTVVATAPGFVPLWAHDAPDFPYAARFVRSNSSEVLSLNFALRRTAGTLRGRLTDPAGSPVRGSIRFAPTAAASLLIDTRVDGTFDVPNLAPGQYRAQVSAGGLGAQWARGKEMEPEADLITVSGGAVTVLEERFLPRGTVEVRLVDARSGAPVAGGCVLMSAPSFGGGGAVCSGPSGIVSLPDAPPGLAELTVRPGNDHMDGFLDQVRVHSGQTTRVTIPLRPAGMIRLTVPRTPAGIVPRVCAFPVPAAIAAAWPTETSGPLCNTDDLGRPLETVATGPISAEPVHLFLSTEWPYGAQWLGATGGTGDRRTAVVLDIGTGGTVDAPQVRLDLGGAITGVVRDRLSGDAVQHVCARPFGLVAGLEMVSTNVPYFTNCGMNGRYELDGLGPYDWPVEILADGYAGVWSGGATNRFRAALVRVPAGGSATVSSSVGLEGRLVGFNFGASPPEFWSVTAFHPSTGDMVGSAAVYHRPELIGLNTGPVLLQYDNYARGVEPCWYAARTAGPSRPLRPRPPTTVHVTAGVDVTGIRLIPDQTCVPTSPRAGVVVPKRPATPRDRVEPAPAPAAPTAPTPSPLATPIRPPKPPRSGRRARLARPSPLR